MLRTTRRLCAGFLLAALPLFCATARAEVEITHKPPGEIAAGARVTLQAEVQDEEAGIELVRAYFRAEGGDDYVFAEMAATGDDAYTGTLPAPAQDTATLDYFLLVKNGAGEVVKSQNFTAEVTAGGDGAAALAARRVILQPSEFAAVEGYHGKLVKLVGDVQVVGENGTARPAGEAGYVVREAETLRTGTDGRAVVDFDGDPITVLEEASRLNVKTPSWLTHLAGRAYFAFKRLLDVSQQERTVASTVALIGIRGTTLLSYAERGVALKDGALNIGSPGGQALEVTRNGTTETTQSFVLDAGRFAGFNGQRVTDAPLSAANRAHIARAEAFLGPLVGDNVTVTAEVNPMPGGVSGFDDNILLVQAPSAGWLGLGAASSTVVAAAGGVSTTTAGVLGALAVGVLVASGSSGSSGSSDGGSSSDSPPPPDKGPGTGTGSDFVGITANYEFIAPGGPAACLRVTDPCGNTFDSSAGSVSCGVGMPIFFVDPPSGTEQVSWTPGPPGTYLFDVIYCGSNPQGAPLSFSADVLVSPNPAQNLTTRPLSDIGDFQSFSFSVP